MKQTMAVFLCAVPVALAAAQSPVIAPGTRIRIETHDRTRIEGTLMQQSAESLVVAAPNAAQRGVSTESIARIRRGNGKSHAHGAVKGLKVGAVIGGGAMALITGGAIFATSTAEPEAFGFAAAFVAAGAFSGALYGVIIGSLVGAERWTTLYTAPPRIALTPAPGTAPGIGLRIGF